MYNTSVKYRMGLDKIKVPQEIEQECAKDNRYDVIFIDEPKLALRIDPFLFDSINSILNKDGFIVCLGTD